jgi:hypothetical protein
MGGQPVQLQQVEDREAREMGIDPHGLRSLLGDLLLERLWEAESGPI